MLKKLSLIGLALSLQSFASTPYASGKSQDIEWQLRLNLPDCQHQGQKPGAWCMASDNNRALEISGVADELKSWIYDSKIKSLHLAYFSFSNKIIRKALCDASEMGKPVSVYLDQSNQSELSSWFKSECKNSENIKVYGLGSTFGMAGSHLQHAKIFLASEDKNLSPLHEQSDKDLSQKIRFTSSSANMSSSGLSLHFENWMMYSTPVNNYLAQQNVCVFDSFKKIVGGNPSGVQKLFAEKYADCTAKIESKKHPEFDFYMVPSVASARKPYQAMKYIIDNAKDKIKIAIHRLTTSHIYKSLLGAASKRGIKISMIMDDDTLRTGIEDGGDAHDVGAEDVKAYRYLRDNTNTEISFMETNAVTVPSAGGVPHLFHNKFIVVDSKVLFQGAGNFTTASLNINRDGNYEQFYVIKNLEIVRAYERGWNELRSRSTKREDHPVGQHRDLDISDIGSF